MIATLVSGVICTGLLNYQMNEIEGVCTAEQKNRYTCPGNNTFFTASVLWGTIGPPKLFGKGGQYTAMLIGFPVGLVFSDHRLLHPEGIPQEELVETNPPRRLNLRPS